MAGKQGRISASRIGFLCVGLFCPAAHVVWADVEFPIAVAGATVIVGDGTTIPNGVIVIENGRIKQVGADVTPPPHADVIDASGMIVYPGFIDAHCHLGIADKPRTEKERLRLEDENPSPKQRALPATNWANRRGMIPHFRVADAFDADADAIKAHQTLGFTTVLSAPRGGIFGGTSALIDLSNQPLRRAIVAADAAQHASFSPWEPGEYPESLLGVIASFRQILLDTQWSDEQEKYFLRHPRLADRPPVDPAIVAVHSVLDGRTPVVFQADGEHEINRALDLAREFNLRIVISGAREAYKVIDRIKKEKTPLIVSLKFDDEPEYGRKKKDVKRRRPAKEESSSDEQKEKPDDPDATESSEKESEDEKEDDDKPRIYEPLKLRQERRRLWEEQVTNVIRLHDAGIEFALSTREFKKPKELFENLRKVIGRGLPIDAAVAALTRTPAQMFNLASQSGRIEPDQIANLVVMTKPLNDEKTKVRYLLSDGRKFEFNRDDKEKDRKADDKKEGDKPEKADEAAKPGAATDQPADVAGGPVWPCEIEADRTPMTRTGGNVLIQNATVITVSGPTIENSSILIQKGRITAVGKGVQAPPGVTVIDAAGKFVIPGMIDCHSHMAVDGVNEGTDAVTAEVRVADTVRNDTVGIYRALAGGVTTTHAMHGSANPIGGQNVVFKLKYKRPVVEMILRDAPRTMKWALGENVKQSNFNEALGKRFPNGRMGVEAVLRDALVAGRRYAEEWNDYRAAVASGKDVLIPRRDLRLEALADVLRGDIWVHTHCYRSDEIVRLMAVAEDFGIRIAVLQHVLEGYRIAPEIARHGASASTFSNFWAYKIEAYGAIPHNAALMTQQGINSTVNSDSANTIRFFPVEAAKCIKWGDLNENQALRLVTLNGAIQLGVEDRLGSIDVGKDGDLAIFNGHPLNSYARNVMTLIEGEVFFEDADQAARLDAGPLDWSRHADVARPESPHRLFALVGGTVHPMTGDAIANGTVIIRNGQIDAVGADVAIPPGAGVVNVAGLYVYPGMIDAGGDIGLTEIGSLRATRDNFDIATFEPELRAATAIHPHTAHVRIARAAGVTSQLARPTGGRVSGQSALINMDGWTSDEMLFADGMAMHMSVPSLPENLSSEQKEKREKEHKESIQEIEDFLRTAKQYAAAVQAGQTVSRLLPKRDLRLEAMIPYVRGEKPVIFAASNYKHILDTIEFAEKHGLKPVISEATESWKLADDLAKKNIPVIFSSPLAYPRGDFEIWDSVYKCAGVLDRAGVKWCFASEGASDVYNLAIEAGFAVSHGLDPDRAMRALTLGAAEILGVDNRLGSLAPGKQADVIVSTHPPTQTVSKVTHVFIRGEPIELTSLHTENYERFKNRPKPLLPPPKDLAGPPSFTNR